ncbi:hypothetical protein [Candidatus Pelagibacter sp. HIMB1593]|uniref:hypothetical protein n=1 Tax=Candidatus Pelagibacter sp. HIMB1593 TaxID=3413355 RepID=UPI003F827B04
MKIHKNIIIGAGLIGCHIFNKISKNSLLITGKTKKVINSRNIHPKIKLKLKKNTTKFSDLIYSKKNDFYIYSSSEIGGLSNYWGKQFFNYQKNDYWPKSIFKKYSSYKKNLDEIDKLYPSPQQNIAKNIKKNNFQFIQINPPILRKPLLSKNNILRKYKKKILEDRVISFKKINEKLILVKTEKKILYCRNLILSAGPIGNALILIRSFKKISYATFKDDNPRMIFGFRFKKSNNLSSNNKNLVDLDIKKKNKLVNFCIIYDVNPYHFSNLLKKIIFFFKDILGKYFFYGQFWINGEYNEIKIKNDKKIILSATTKNKYNYDTRSVKNLNKIGLKVFKILNLKFAFGFHYHCLKIKFNGKLFSINQFLNNRKLNKNVYCFDSSVIEKIGLKPPTKTYLATANHLIKKFEGKFK